MKDRRTILAESSIALLTSAATGIILFLLTTGGTRRVLLALVILFLVCGIVVIFTVEPPKDLGAHERDLMEKVRAFWLNPLLEEREDSISWINIGIQWRISRCSEAPYAPGRTLPQQTPLVQIFEEAGRRLLILGTPGAGKTIALLKLAQDLAVRAASNPEEPVPVVLNLSSWAEPTPKLLPWLLRELRVTYRIPDDIALTLIRQNRLLLFLDGLDEVKVADRPSCVRSINNFLTVFDHLPGVIVCSRAKEYEALPVLLQTSEIQLLRLSNEAVEQYIIQSELKPQQLLATLGRNPGLKKSLRSPLMLKFLRSLYENPLLSFPEEWPGKSEQCETLIIELYVRGRTSSEASLIRYPEAKLRKWLSWVADRMSRDSQSVLLLEKLQPNWLSTTNEIRLYTFISRSLSTLIVVLIGVLIMWLGHRARIVVGDGGVPTQDGLLGVQENLWFWVFVTGVLGGWTFALVDLRAVIQNSTHPTSTYSKGYKVSRELAGAALNILICAVVFFLAALYRLPVIKAIYGALIYGVCFGMVFWFRRRDNDSQADIKTTDKISWSWSTAVTGSAWGLVGGATVGLVISSIVGWFAGYKSGFNIGAVVLVGGFLVGVAVGGLKKVSVEGRKMSFYEGLRLSAVSTLRIWMYVGLLSVTVFWFYGSLRYLIMGYPLTNAMQAPLEPALFFGLVLGLLIAFSYSGLDIIYHITLRFVLSLRGRIPLRYVSFLNHLSEIKLLYRAGGGYLFVHPLVLQQLADQADSDSASTPNSTGRRRLVHKYLNHIFSSAT
ncbi:MAG TPA: NACHT domain-containing protein [Pyrinomonadaceae bacterium]|nr:NACHT domain-containing protein [Pyrinomonadaceae bacterium]